MKQTITITTMPVTTNRLYKTSPNIPRPIVTKKAGAMKEAVAWEAKAEWPHEVLECDIKVEMIFYWPDKRKRDVDNVKGFIDAFNRIVWQDDSQITDLTLRKRVHASDPRVEITVIWKT